MFTGMLISLLLASFVPASGWMVSPAASSPARQQAVGQAPVCRAVRMQEGDAPTAEPEAFNEAFADDLLDALAAEEPDLAAPTVEGGVFVTADGADELAPLASYVNYLTIEEAKLKYKTHEADTGSAQVQVAVLTARIAYMTKHMQENKKDYASLRGLTAMVTRRRKLLEYLLREDLPEFKRLTSELGIRTNQLLKPKLGGARGRRV